MDKETLRQIIFQSKHVHKQYRTRSRKYDAERRREQQSGKVGSICLLGSLQLQERHITFEDPNSKKFQIVQLKKHRTSTPRRQQSKFDTALKSQIKNRQIRSQRDSFKVERIQNAQLGMFQKSFGIKFSQNPIYLMQGEMITNSRGLESNRKNDRLDKFDHGKSSLNVESLPEKFIPSNILNSKEYKKIYEQEKRKIIEERNKSFKKNLYLDLHSVKFALSGMKQSDRAQIQQFQSTQIQSQPFIGQGSSSQLNIINRTTSMAGVPKKNYLKKIFQQQKQLQDKLQLQKKQALQIRKQVNKNYAKPFNPPENISAQSYIVYEITKKQSRYRKSFQASYNQRRRYMNSHKILVEMNSRTPVEIASLTKIMTLAVALDICEKYNKDSTKEIVKIGLFETNITGTTANLIKGEIYTLEQLFYGLMLPSGNDASLAIAVWGGKALLQNSQNATIEQQNSIIKRKRIFYQRFLQQMNKKASELGMQKTHYANSHGLMNFDNKSCAFDLALLCQYAMKKEKFRDIVKTKIYECTIQSEKEDTSTIASPTLTNRSSQINLEAEYSSEMKDMFANESAQQFPVDQAKQVDLENLEQIENQVISPLLGNKSQNKLFTKQVFWENTHLLVQEKSSLYKGIKTGITNAAGPCLASLVQHKQRQFIFIVLNCRTMKQRFRDTENLRKWTFEKQQIKFQQD